MKLAELRKIIREEVRAAVKEEVQDMLTEAIKIASAPTKMQPAPIAGQTSWSAPKQAQKIQSDPIMEMLNMTKKSMTAEDYNQVMSMDSTNVAKPNFAQSMASQMGMTGTTNHNMASQIGMTGEHHGLDLSQLGFVKKAKAVFDASNEKDKTRQGL